MSVGVSSLFARLGIATFTELTVATISTRLRHIVARIAQRRWYTCGSIPPGIAGTPAVSADGVGMGFLPDGSGRR